jgi:hypothetical protein
MNPGGIGSVLGFTRLVRCRRIIEFALYVQRRWPTRKELRDMSYMAIAEGSPCWGANFKGPIF